MLCRESVLFIFIFTLFVQASCEALKQTKASQMKLIVPKLKNCKHIKCPAVEEPVCTKIKYNKGNHTKTMYIVMINKCEMEYMKCHQGMQAFVVPMKNCGHDVENGAKRSKRDVNQGRRWSDSNGEGSSNDEDEGLRVTRARRSKTVEGKKGRFSNTTRKENKNKPKDTKNSPSNVTLLKNENIEKIRTNSSKLKTLKKRRNHNNTTNSKSKLKTLPKKRKEKNIKTNSTSKLNLPKKGDKQKIIKTASLFKKKKRHHKHSNSPNLRQKDEKNHVKVPLKGGHKIYAANSAPNDNDKIIRTGMFDEPLFSDNSQKSLKGTVRNDDSESEGSTSAEVAKESLFKNNMFHREKLFLTDNENRLLISKEYGGPPPENLTYSDFSFEYKIETPESDVYNSEDYNAENDNVEDHNVNDDKEGNDAGDNAGHGKIQKLSHKIQTVPNDNKVDTMDIISDRDINIDGIQSGENVVHSVNEDGNDNEGHDGGNDNHYGNDNQSSDNDDAKANENEAQPSNEAITSAEKQTAQEKIFEEIDAETNVAVDSNQLIDEVYDTVIDTVDEKENEAECPTQCAARNVMVCAKCIHDVYRTFMSTCHMRMFNCKHSDEKLELVSRYPCTLSAPYLTNTPEPKGRIAHPDDDDRVLRFIECREKGQINEAIALSETQIADSRCNFPDPANQK